MKNREHIVIEPVGQNVDFLQKNRDVSKIWFPRSPAWIATLLPAAITAACNGSDFTYSTWRKFPLRSHDNFTIPDEGAFLVKVYCQIGENFDPDLWTCLSYYDARRPPVASSERFHLAALKGILTDTLAAPEEIDKLRTLNGRPRAETWVRHDLTAISLAPDAIDIPRYLMINQDDPEAAQRMQALRAPMPPGEYHRLRQKEREEKERAAAAEAESFAVAAVALDQVTRTEPPREEPKCLSRDDLMRARGRREKMARATKSKVAADRENAASAERWGRKMAARMDRT